MSKESLCACSGCFVQKARLFAVILATLCLQGINLDAIAAPDKDVAVIVHIKDGEVALDVNCFVRATPQQVWAVLTDYGNATRFISNLEKSEILSKNAETLVVAQKGKMGLGPFSVSLETVTEIRLAPFHGMQSRMLSGSMIHHESTTRLSPEESGTRIVYHADSNPNTWMPPLIGEALVAHEARERFSQLLDEILRRENSVEIGR